MFADCATSLINLRTCAFFPGIFIQRPNVTLVSVSPVTSSALANEVNRSCRSSLSHLSRASSMFLTCLFTSRGNIVRETFEASISSISIALSNGKKAMLCLTSQFEATIRMSPSRAPKNEHLLIVSGIPFNAFLIAPLPSLTTTISQLITIDNSYIPKISVVTIFASSSSTKATILRRGTIPSRLSTQLFASAPEGSNDLPPTRRIDRKFSSGISEAIEGA